VVTEKRKNKDIKIRFVLIDQSNTKKEVVAASINTGVCGGSHTFEYEAAAR
jgi:hypothetical protein